MSDIIRQFKEGLSNYGKAVGNAGKLKVIDFASRLVGYLLLVITVVLLLFAVLCFCSVAVVSALGAYMPIWAAALIVGGVHVVLIGIVCVYRKPLFVYPFLRLMSQGKIRSEAELEIETLKAEHAKEMYEANFFAQLVIELLDRFFGRKEAEEQKKAQPSPEAKEA